MNSNQKAIGIPDAIYFDTNILLRLSHDISDVDFIEMRHVSRELHIELFAPRVVIREWINKQECKIIDLMSRMKETSQNLGRLLGRSPIEYEELDEVTNCVNKRAMEYLDKAGIKEIPLPKNVQLDTLIEMAVKREAPFEEKGEKGFRDAVILFSIIEHMQANIFAGAILISADKIFTHDYVTARFKNAGLNILVKESFADAKQYINEHIDLLIKSYNETKKKEIKLFLDTKFSDISEYVLQNAKISPLFLQSGGLAGLLSDEKNLGLLDTIKKIKRITPKEISDVSQDILFSEETLEEGAQGVTFSVAVEFTLATEQYNPYSNQPKFSLSIPEDFERIRYESPLPNETEKIIVRNISLEAIISKKGDSYSDLQILRVNAY